MAAAAALLFLAAGVCTFFYIGRFLAKEPIEARPEGLGHRVRRALRDRAFELIVLGVLLAVVAVPVVDRLRQEDEGHAALEEAEVDLYRTRLELARAACDAGQMDRARALLEACAPKPGRPDRRGPEWRQLWMRCQPNEDK